MTKKSKLEALVSTCEMEEQRIFQEKQRVDGVIEQRRRIVETLSAKLQTLREKQKQFREGKRLGAFRASDIGHLASIAGYEGRLQAEIDHLERIIAGRRQELNRAEERGTMVLGELVEARLALKRVEKLLESRETRSRAVDAATEQALHDDLSMFRRRNQ